MNDKHIPKVSVAPEISAHLRYSDYVFLDIPFTGENVWSLSISKPYASWIASFSIPRLILSSRTINFLKFDRVLKLQQDIIGLFVKYELHEENDWNQYSQMIVQSNSKFSKSA